ncbi:MAG: ribosome biogenesis GTPase Der, partial [Ignavibacteriales bacterium]|nr:ribosome biogenesis GTPase Der [Ignavibacteriales bacterium]
KCNKRFTTYERIEEADKIVFVVDVKDGVTAIDRDVAHLIRSSGKPYLLVVNKVDSEHQEAFAHEFHSLGLGEPFTLSASVGRKSGDFLDELTADFPENLTGEEDTRLKIAIVGRPNVGKSSLTNALLGFDRSLVTDIPGTTRDSLDSVLKYYGEEIILIDTAGLRKRTKVKEGIEFFSAVRTLKAISECDVAVVMVDGTLGIEKQDQKILDEAVSRRKGILIVVNKWDLVEKDSNTAPRIEKYLKENMGLLDYLPVVFTSALTKQRIFKVIDSCKEINARRKFKIPTSDLNEVMRAEIERIPPPSAANGREIKIKYITQAGDHYPVFLFFANYPKNIPESYGRFLENMLRKHYDFVGVPLTLAFKEK